MEFPSFSTFSQFKHLKVSFFYLLKMKAQCWIIHYSSVSSLLASPCQSCPCREPWWNWSPWGSFFGSVRSPWAQRRRTTTERSWWRRRESAGVPADRVKASPAGDLTLPSLWVSSEKQIRLWCKTAWMPFFIHFTQNDGDMLSNMYSFYLIRSPLKSKMIQYVYLRLMPSFVAKTGTISTKRKLTFSWQSVIKGWLTVRAKWWWAVQDRSTRLLDAETRFST